MSMDRRKIAPLVLLALIAGAPRALAATHRTDNFEVTAPTEEAARQVAEVAERSRKELSKSWLGRELPDWDQRCPLRVTLSTRSTGGSTEFGFDSGLVLGLRMRVEGTLEKLLANVVPHEVTHAVLAHHFRQVVPRWADEGAAILSEGEAELRRQDRLVQEILDTPGRAMPLRRLFSARQYPPDGLVLYAQGYSVSRFLVRKKGRETFLAFVRQGTNGSWDAAVEKHYGYRNVDDLEKAWLASLRAERAARSEEKSESTPAPQGSIP